MEFKYSRQKVWKKSTSNATLPPAYLLLAYLPPSYLLTYLLLTTYLTADLSCNLFLTHLFGLQMDLNCRPVTLLLSLYPTELLKQWWKWMFRSWYFSEKKTCKILASESNSIGIILMKHALLQKYANGTNFIHTFYILQNVTKMCGDLCWIQMKKLTWLVVVPKCISRKPICARGVRIIKLTKLT